MSHHSVEYNTAQTVQQRPSVGRIVHFVDPDTQLHLAAIVAVEDKPLTSGTQLAGLSVFYPHVVNERGTFREGVRFLPLRMQDEVDKRPGTWHFPERD